MGSFREYQRRERDMAELCKFPPESIAMLKCIKPGKKRRLGKWTKFICNYLALFLLSKLRCMKEPRSLHSHLPNSWSMIFLVLCLRSRLLLPPIVPPRLLVICRSQIHAIIHAFAQTCVLIFHHSANTYIYHVPDTVFTFSQKVVHIKHKTRQDLGWSFSYLQLRLICL